MAASFDGILKEIDDALNDFQKSIPQSEQNAYAQIIKEVNKLQTNDNGTIQTSVANLKVLNGIKNRLSDAIVNDAYLGKVSQFSKIFDRISDLQQQYFTALDSTFTPPPVLSEIKTQSIADTVRGLTESGIGGNFSDAITQLLQTSITSGGSYQDLADELRNRIVSAPGQDSQYARYAKQITTDAVQQYNAQYINIASGDLGYEWYAYQGSDIKTTRPFCWAMTERKFFHVSEVPGMLAAKLLGKPMTYVDFYSKKRKPVTLYVKTGLPKGMIGGTTPLTFPVNRGGYNCGHQTRPVPERLVPPTLIDEVKATDAYKNWLKTPAAASTPPPKAPKPAEAAEAPVKPFDVSALKTGDTFTSATGEKYTVTKKGDFFSDITNAAGEEFSVNDQNIENLVKAGTFEILDASPYINTVHKDYSSGSSSARGYAENVASDLVDAVKAYTGNLYGEMNYFLRTGKTQVTFKNGVTKEYVTADALNAIPKATEFLREAPKYTGTYYRGEQYTGVNNPDFLNLEKNLTVGAEFTQVGFNSMSASESVAKRFAGAGGEDAIIYTVKNGTRGVPVDEISLNAGEDELLIAPGARYRVVERSESVTKYDSKIIRLTIEEI